MSNLKKPSENNKVSKSTIAKRGGNCPQMPAFSFAYLTTNSTYNLDYFSNNNDKRTAIENIYMRLLEICRESWMHWHSLPKKQGLEMLPADEIEFSPSGKKLMPDEKVIVFQVKGYAGKNARILGIREEGCPILYIIGYDFDFSAYNHG